MSYFKKIAILILEIWCEHYDNRESIISIIEDKLLLEAHFQLGYRVISFTGELSHYSK